MKLILSLLFLQFSLISFSQTKGYFGKKNILEFGLSIQNPALYNFNISVGSDYEESKAYLNKNGTLRSGYPKLNLGYRLSLGRMLERNFGFYIESGLSYFSVVPTLESYSIYGSSNIMYSNLQGEMVDIQSFSIVPKIEFATKDALLPIGVSNQIGFGFNYYKAIAKDYIGTVMGNNYDSLGYGIEVPIAINQDNYYNFNNRAIKGYTFLYKLSMRIPINEKMFFHFGFRYTFNFVPSYFSTFSNSSTTSSDILTYENMRSMIKRKENRNLINFETGISYSF